MVREDARKEQAAGAGARAELRSGETEEYHVSLRSGGKVRIIGTYTGEQVMSVLELCMRERRMSTLMR